MVCLSSGSGHLYSLSFRSISALDEFRGNYFLFPAMVIHISMRFMCALYTVAPKIHPLATNRSILDYSC